MWFHLPSLLLRKCEGDPALPLLHSGRSTCIWWELDTGATRSAWPNTAIIFLTCKSNCQETGSDYTFLHSLHAAALERKSITTLSSVCTWAVCSWTLQAPKALLQQLTAHWLKKHLQWEKEQILGPQNLRWQFSSCCQSKQLCLNRSFIYAE